MPAPRWLSPLREQIVRTNQAIQQAIGRVETLSPADMEGLLNDLGQLLTNLTNLTVRLQGEDDVAQEE